MNGQRAGTFEIAIAKRICTSAELLLLHDNPIVIVPSFGVGRVICPLYCYGRTLDGPDASYTSATPDFFLGTINSSFINSNIRELILHPNQYMSSALFGAENTSNIPLDNTDLTFTDIENWLGATFGLQWVVAYIVLPTSGNDT